MPAIRYIRSKWEFLLSKRNIGIAFFSVSMNVRLLFRIFQRQLIQNIDGSDWRNFFLKYRIEQRFAFVPISRSAMLTTCPWKFLLTAAMVFSATEKAVNGFDNILKYYIQNRYCLPQNSTLSFQLGVGLEVASAAPRYGGAHSLEASRRPIRRPAASAQLC